MSHEITFADLPDRAKDLISPEQQSYIDEFTFIYDEGYIEAWYAGELLAYWNGSGWIDTLDALTGRRLHSHR